jgi:hypothetical protein
MSRFISLSSTTSTLPLVFAASAPAVAAASSRKTRGPVPKVPEPGPNVPEEGPEVAGGGEARAAATAAGDQTPDPGPVDGGGAGADRALSTTSSIWRAAIWILPRSDTKLFSPFSSASSWRSSL